MMDGTTPMSAMSGPAAIAAAVANLERHTRTIVQTAITKQELRGDAASTVAEMHDRIARLLDDVSRSHGIDTMDATAEYASAALEAGLIYPGSELEDFVRRVAVAVRSTSRELSKAGGSGGTGASFSL